MPNIQYTLSERWDASKLPGHEENAEVFAQFDRVHAASRPVLHCAVPLTRAQQLTDFQMPEGWDADKCFYTAGAGKFAEGLSQWKFTPRIRSQAQLPQMEKLPISNADLALLPWFRSAGQGRGLGLNARHLRYHYALWQEMKPKIVRGLHTTLLLATPQLGYSLTPHIQLTKAATVFLRASRRGRTE